MLGEIWSKRLSSFTKPTTRTARWKSISFAEATHCGALPPGIDVSPPRSWPRSTTSAPPATLLRWDSSSGSRLLVIAIQGAFRPVVTVLGDKRNAGCFRH